MNKKAAWWVSVLIEISTKAIQKVYHLRREEGLDVNVTRSDTVGESATEKVI